MRLSLFSLWPSYISLWLDYKPWNCLKQLESENNFEYIHIIVSWLYISFNKKLFYSSLQISILFFFNFISWSSQHTSNKFKLMKASVRSLCPHCFRISRIIFYLYIFSFLWIAFAVYETKKNHWITKRIDRYFNFKTQKNLSDFIKNLLLTTGITTTIKYYPMLYTQLNWGKLILTFNPKLKLPPEIHPADSHPILHKLMTYQSNPWLIRSKRPPIQSSTPNPNFFWRSAIEDSNNRFETDHTHIKWKST